MSEQIPIPELPEDEMEKDLNDGTKPENLDLEAATEALEQEGDKLRSQIEQDPNMTPEAKALRSESTLPAAQEQTENILKTSKNKGLNSGFLSNLKNPEICAKTAGSLFAIGIYTFATGNPDSLYYLGAGLLASIFAILLKRAQRGKKEDIKSEDN